jgi:hypothetical protein
MAAVSRRDPRAATGRTRLNAPARSRGRGNRPRDRSACQGDSVDSPHNTVEAAPGRDDPLQPLPVQDRRRIPERRNQGRAGSSPGTNRHPLPRRGKGKMPSPRLIAEEGREDRPQKTREQPIQQSQQGMPTESVGGRSLTDLAHPEYGFCSWLLFMLAADWPACPPVPRILFVCVFVF